MRTASRISLLALVSSAAAIKGFNYGSTFTNGAAKAQSDFEAEFTTAANLEGTDGFTSARLYTMIVCRAVLPLVLHIHVSFSRTRVVAYKTRSRSKPELLAILFQQSRLV